MSEVLFLGCKRRIELPSPASQAGVPPLNYKHHISASWENRTPAHISTGCQSAINLMRLVSGYKDSNFV